MNDMDSADTTAVVPDSVDYSDSIDKILANQSNFQESFDKFTSSVVEKHDKLIDLLKANQTDLLNGQKASLKSLDGINQSLTTIDSDLIKVHDVLKPMNDTFTQLGSVNWHSVIDTLKTYSEFYSTVHFGIGVILGCFCGLAFVMGVNKI